MQRNVLVFGGTGNYGQHIVRSLLKRKIPVKVFTRDSIKAEQKLGKKPTYFEGNVLNKDDVKKSLENVNSVIISLSALHPKLIKKLEEIEYESVMTIIDEAEKRGISKIVYISIYDMREDLIQKLNLDIGIIKQKIESYLAKSSINWVVLGCPPSYMIFTRFMKKRKLIVPGGGSELMPSVAPEDVGEMAAEAAIRDDLSCKRFHMTYAEPFAFKDVAKRISKIIERKIRYQKIPLFGLKLASIITYPFYPYLRHIVKYVKLLNNFPLELAEQVPDDFKILQETFNYEPMSLEEYIRKYHIIGE